MTYGCHNRAPHLTSTPVQDGYYMDGYTRTPRMVSMPFRMSPTCQYRETELGKADQKCTGCSWRKGDSDVEMAKGVGGIAEPGDAATAAPGNDSDHE